MVTLCLTKLVDPVGKKLSFHFAEIISAVTEMDHQHHFLRPSFEGHEHEINTLLRRVLQQCWSNNPKIRPKMKDLRRDIYACTGITPANVSSLSESMLKRYECYIKQLEEELQERTDLILSQCDFYQELICEIWPRYGTTFLGRGR